MIEFENEKSRATIFLEKLAITINSFDMEELKKIKVNSGYSTSSLINLIEEYYSKTINSNLFFQKNWDKMVYEPLKQIFESKEKLLLGYGTPIDFLRDRKFFAILSLSQILFPDRNEIELKNHFENMEFNFSQVYRDFYLIFNEFFETSKEVEEIMNDFSLVDQKNRSQNSINPCLELSNALKKHKDFYDVLNVLSDFVNLYNLELEFSIYFNTENNNFNLHSFNDGSSYGLYGLNTNESLNFIDFFVEDYYNNLNSSRIDKKEYLNNLSIDNLLFETFKNKIQSWNLTFNEKLLEVKSVKNNDHSLAYSFLYKTFELPTETLSDEDLSSFLKENYGELISFISKIKSIEERERIVKQFISLLN